MGGCAGVCSRKVAPTEVGLHSFRVFGTCGKGGFGKVMMVSRKKGLPKNALFALKRMSKELILEKKMSKHVWLEREVLKLNASTKSPFLCSLAHAFQTKAELFFVMELMQGGNLRYQTSLQPGGVLTESQLRFYLPEIILGLQTLHSYNIIYRDMKPDNVLLGLDGHVRLSDFGLAFVLSDPAQKVESGRSGTPGYMAPEQVMAGKRYGRDVDFFQLGVTAYELLHNRRPFDDAYRAEGTVTATASWRNLFVNPKYDPTLSADCISLLAGLLEFDPKQRLGCGGSGWEEVLRHPFFKATDWAAVGRLEAKAPILPSKDSMNREIGHEIDDQFLDESPRAPRDSGQQRVFDGWEWNVLPGTGDAYGITPTTQYRSLDDMSSPTATSRSLNAAAGGGAGGGRGSSGGVGAGSGSGSGSGSGLSGRGAGGRGSGSGMAPVRQEVS